MFVRRSLMVVFGLAFLCTTTRFAFADPPVGLAGEWWYEGIWKLTIKERCFQHTNGKPLPKQKENLFMRLTWNPETLEYDVGFYLDREALFLVGFANLDFRFPAVGVESFLINGSGFKLVSVPIEDIPGGIVFFQLMGVLSTAVNRASEGIGLAEIQKLQGKSQMMGWNLALFSPDSGDFPNLHCKSSWKARWISPLSE